MNAVVILPFNILGEHMIVMERRLNGFESTPQLAIHSLASAITLKLSVSVVLKPVLFDAKLLIAVEIFANNSASFAL